MQANVLLVAGVILFIFLAWASSGGPERAASWQPLLGSPFKVASSSISDTGAERSERNEERELSRIQEEVVDLQRSAVSAARFGTPSEYRDRVTLSLGTSATSDDPDREYVTITVSTREEEPVNVTGWRLSSSAKGRTIAIPTGVNVPRSSTINIEEAVILNPGDRAIVVVGESPVGYSFRENMCTGYLDQFQEFYPKLAHQCPAPVDDFDRFYLGSERQLDSCRAFLRGENRCEIPRDIPSSVGNECENFIDTHLDYNGCVDMHLGDRDFLSSTWRVYLERESGFFTEDHDTLKLLDASGKTVDLVSY
ncbi:MAG: hypothetical protein KBC38_02090 [Candidatus Pacebacteria bacterium]|nr:hypothetical protein [Candidatus Paceibacterota bacterium]MBP9840077.1 hypothetical protein [Candidatus Paceibacterota bacterium]